MIRKAKDIKSEIRHQMRGGKESVTIRHFFSKDELSAKCRLCGRLVLPPGASIGMHKHEMEDEVFIIERGKGILDDGHSQTNVESGDVILTGNGAEHALINNGNEPLELIAVIMGY